MKMKKAVTFIGLVFLNTEMFCCTTCNLQLRQAIYNSTFLPNLFTMLSAFILLAVIVSLLAYLSERRHTRNKSAQASKEIVNPVPLKTAAIVLGIGIGGFIDGIVFHQLLQWHEMISNKIPPVTLLAKSVNMFWDGIFHAFNLLVVITGIVLLWQLLERKNINKSAKLFFGGLLVGWGLFNIVEGIINHQLLKLHYVKDVTNNVEAWNYGFLFISALILLLGFFLGRQKIKGKSLV